MIDISTKLQLEEIAKEAIKDFEEQTKMEFGYGMNCKAKELIEFYGGKIENDHYISRNLIYKSYENIIYLLNPNLIGVNNTENMVLLTLFSHYLLSYKEKKFELGEIIYPDKKLFVDQDKYKERLNLDSKVNYKNICKI